MIRNFKQIENRIKQEAPKTIAVALAEDSDVLKAIERTRKMRLASAILTGNEEIIASALAQLKINSDNYEIVHADSEKEAIETAVQSVRSGKAQVIMKGLCSTASFLKGILNRENGLRSGKVLSHLALFQSSGYHKLFMMSDAAMNIAPDIAIKVAITENAIAAAHRLGYEQPKVAMISAVEKVNHQGMPSSVDAAIIAKMGERGQIKGALIDGPLAVDNALSKQACAVKSLQSPVGGDADILIVPNIETGNAFYKLLTLFADAKVAGLILGAAAPVVLTSRADSDESKFLSILTALKIG